MGLFSRMGWARRYLVILWQIALDPSRDLVRGLVIIGANTPRPSDIYSPLR